MAALSIDQVQARPEPKRDRHGRYVLPGRDGKPVSFTRATTVAGVLDDKTALEYWTQNRLLLGIGRRPDLVALAQSHDPENDKGVYRNIRTEALAAAETQAASGMGTALHRFSELLDAGQRQLDDLPAEHQPIMRRYVNALDAAGVEVEPDHIEQIVMVDDYGVAGTVDRIVTLADGRRVIADLKTGKSVTKGWLRIAVQLAIYANHSATYDVLDDKRSGRTDVDREHGLIIHLPAHGERCQLYMVDLAKGWDAFLTAMEVREWRRANELAEEYKPAEVGIGGAMAETQWIFDRIARLDAHDGAVVALLRNWPADMPQPLPDALSGAQVTAMAGVLDVVEAQYEMPFGLARPGT